MGTTKSNQIYWKGFLKANKIKLGCQEIGRGSKSVAKNVLDFCCVTQQFLLALYCK